MNKFLYIAIALLISGLLLWFFVNSKNTQNNNQEKVLMDSEFEEPIKQDDYQDGDGNETVSIGSYSEYDPGLLKEDKKNILFFHAKWCPSCKRLNDNLVENIKNIPNDLNILKVDYDSQTAFKAKYGVTMQHTLIQVDSEGVFQKKVNGLYSIYTLSELVELLNNGN